MATDKAPSSVQELPPSSSNSSKSDLDAPRRASLKEGRDNAGPTGPAITAFWRSKKTRLDPEAIATQKSVFDNPELIEYFKPRANYENIARFDPDARWTWGEELPLIRKLDWKVTLWACTSKNPILLLSRGLGSIEVCLEILLTTRRGLRHSFFRARPPARQHQPGELGRLPR